jgi:hypothetical protein
MESTEYNPRTPHGIRTESTRNPHAVHTESTQNPHGVRTESARSPHRIHMESARSPHGIRTESARSPHGIRTDSTRSLHGVSTESIWTPWRRVGECKVLQNIVKLMDLTDFILDAHNTKSCGNVLDLQRLRQDTPQWIE